MNTNEYIPTPETAAKHLRAYQFGEPLDGIEVSGKHSFGLNDADVNLALMALEHPFYYICECLLSQKGLNNHGFETNSETIFAETYEKAKAIADFLEAGFGYVIRIEEYDDGYVIEPD